MPADERFVELYFPVGGLDLSQEFQGQGPQTTPDAQNVRAVDPESQRERGGSRCGITRYINQQLAGEIQHLNMIVDPQADRLRQNFIVPGNDWIEDPLNPGTYVPPGGWGNPPNPNASPPSPPPPPSTPAYVQSKGLQSTTSDTSTRSVTFDATADTDSTVVVFVATTSAQTGVTVDVENNAATNLTQAGSYYEVEHPAGGGVFCRVSMWYKTVNAGSNDSTLKATPSDNSALTICALEYSGVVTTSQLDGTSGTTDSTLSPAVLTTGNIAVNGANEVAVGCFADHTDNDTFSAGAGCTHRIGFTDGSAAPRINVVDKYLLNNPGDDPTALTGNITLGNIPYVAVGASFKD
jgi:hypothetical protein